MEEQDKEYQFVPCECGKTLRLTVSEKNYGKEVITVCPHCKMKHRVTISSPEIPHDNLDADFEEIKSYTEMLAGKLNQILQDARERKDIANLIALFVEKGFSIGLIVSISILKNGNVQQREMPEAKSDADFLKKMNIRYD